MVDLLRRNQAILEINAVDLKIQSEHDLEKYRTRHLARQSESLHEFKGNAIAKVIASNQQIAETSLQLYLQALMVTHLLHRVVNTSTLYFSQRQPKELNNFSWIVDGKDKQRITKWETWLEWFSKGAISTMSKTKPFMRLIEGDYLHFGKYDLKDSDGANIGIDIKALFQDFRYSSSPEIGLELVDIVVTATRRALVGNLNATGFNKISSLMIHHRDEYIKFLVFKPDGINITQQTSYGSVVQKYFMSGGRSMVPLSYFEDN